MTTPTSNGEWAEYRRLILSWHDDEVAARKEIREKLEVSNKTINSKLDNLAAQLAVLKTERRIVLGLMGVVVPIILSAAVSLAIGLK